MNNKTLYRLNEGRMICGVCAGLGEYFEIDPNLVRLAAVILACTGMGLVAYIVAAIILPVK
ncbi:phage shock protein C (PspC) family protein [Ruminococcaceae bacterium FB2012]|jgi:phage shock protein PspC (stress-responsive transcriptional regulator)|nr:phage shock protein C (PspC) family protein [Ruminococcaceae bacterium FB2012]